MLTKEECEKAKEILRMANDYPVSKYNDSDLISNAINAFENLIHEHFDNNQIDWLKKCMGEENFDLIFSSEEEVKKWIDRVNWHLKKVDELGRELQKLKKQSTA